VDVVILDVDGPHESRRRRKARPAAGDRVVAGSDVLVTAIKLNAIVVAARNRVVLDYGARAEASIRVALRLGTDTVPAADDRVPGQVVGTGFGGVSTFDPDAVAVVFGAGDCGVDNSQPGAVPAGDAADVLRTARGVAAGAALVVVLDVERAQRDVAEGAVGADVD
jgi:hypothetical protein